MPLTPAEKQKRYRERQRYMADAEKGARIAYQEQRGSLNLVTEEQRVERALDYAVWRWDGFHRGEIAGL